MSNQSELDEIFNDDYFDVKVAKQAILDWHNKQIDSYKGIIKMADKYTFDTGEVYYSQKAVNRQIEEVLDRLLKHGEDFTTFGDGGRSVAVEYIEAERNKLKEPKV